MVIKAILFDLDGTLLNVNMGTFLPVYLTKLSAYFAPLIDPDRFITSLLTSTECMIRSTDPNRTNSEVFRENFHRLVQGDIETLLPFFESFYLDVYPQLRSYTEPYPHAPNTVRKAKEKKGMVALATNPVFPLEAIRQRVAWAGLDESDFSLVTSYENMHYCKPRPEYFREVAALLGVSPAECLMVGNDVDEDIFPAQAAGLKTYLTTDFVVNKSGRTPKPDYCGPVADFPRILDTL